MPRRTGEILSNIDNDKQEQMMRIMDERDDDLPTPSKSNQSDLSSLGNLRDLIYLGRLSRTINVGNFKFSLVTPTIKEQKDLVKKMMKIDQNERILEIKTLSVAQCLETINGVPVEQICEDNTIEDKLDRKINVVSTFQSTLIDRLYKVYEELIDESNKELGLEEIKK